ncbi:hypothetical protein FOZ60_007428 [Perkinsus olseni]|uniref:Uncharacterized protein n=1 Tax=Perkinsus olseni TaxID=32597 RepID=A0A7J6NM96_PEROL|nr:hypothetical protein FOZ60_007428 [Perkinsus olseni]
MARRRREALQSVICAKARALVIDWRSWTRRRIDKRLGLTLMKRALAGWREFARRRIRTEDARVILEMRVSAWVKRSTCYEWAVASRKVVAARRFLCARLAGAVWRKWVQLVRQSCILTVFSTWRRRVLSVPREVDRVRLRRCFKGWLIRCGDLRRAARNGEECRAMRADIWRLSVLLSWCRLRMLWEGARRFAAVSLRRRAMKQWVEQRKLGKIERRRLRKIFRNFADRIMRTNFYAWHDLCRVRDFMRLRDFRLKRRCIDRLIDFVADKKLWRVRRREADGQYIRMVLGRCIGGFRQCMERHRWGRAEAYLRLKRGLLRKWWLKWTWDVRPLLRRENGRWLMAVNCHWMGLLTKGWKGMVLLLRRKQVDRRKMREARVMVMRLRTAAGLWRWRRWMERRKQQWKIWQEKSSTLCSSRDKKLLRSAFLTWRVDFLYYNHLKRLVVGVARRYRTLVQWRKWCVGIGMAMEQRQLVERWMDECRRRTLGSMFIALKAAVEQSLLIRYNNSTALFHWADGLCRDVWQQWVSYVHHRHCVNALQHRADEFLRSALMRSYLRKYRDRVVSRKIGRGAVRRLLATIEVRLRRRYLSRWVACCNRQQYLRASVDAAAERRHRRLRHRCLLAWRWRVRELRRAVGLLADRAQYCLLKWGMCGMVIAMENWRRRRQETLAVLVLYRWRRFIRGKNRIKDTITAVEGDRGLVVLRSEREKEIWTRLEEIRAEISRIKTQDAAGG